MGFKDCNRNSLYCLKQTVRNVDIESTAGEAQKEMRDMLLETRDKREGIQYTLCV